MHRRGSRFAVTFLLAGTAIGPSRAGAEPETTRGNREKALDQEDPSREGARPKSSGEEDARGDEAARGEAAPERLNFVVPTLHGLGQFTLQRVAEGIFFPNPFARFQDWGKHYEEAFTKPPLFDPSRPAFEWDGDHWTTNIIGHGLMGSELYLRARHCHFGVAGSLLFTTSASVLWEYAFEGNGVRPSAQDLVYTPIMGLALGEVRYFVWKSAGGKGQKVIRALFDPFGELERALGTPC